MYKNAGLKEETNPDIAKILTEALLKLDPKIIEAEAFKDNLISALKESVEMNQAILDEETIILNAFNKITNEIKDNGYKDKPTESRTIKEIKAFLTSGKKWVENGYSPQTPGNTPYKNKINSKTELSRDSSFSR
jgi:hypothetical protein